MTNCKNFIDGIAAINVSEQGALDLKNLLIALTIEEWQKEIATIEQQLAALPKDEDATSTQQPLIQHYRETQQNNIDGIREQMAKLSSGSTANKTNINDDFINDFAKHFRNIKHLAYVLSDAPPVIKEQQTKIYFKILNNLSPKEQEEQLKSLSLAELQDMMRSAISAFDNTPAAEAEYKSQCQKLVQMAAYEIIQRDCSKVTDSRAPDYDRYQQIMASINQNIPDVGRSSILDSFSDYRSPTDNKSVSELLLNVETKLNVQGDQDLSKNEKWGALKGRKALLDKLRFGQDDRREYSKQTEANLKRDLFINRNLSEMAIFTEAGGGVADKTFKALQEKDALNTLLSQPKITSYGLITENNAVGKKKDKQDVYNRNYFNSAWKHFTESIKSMGIRDVEEKKQLFYKYFPKPLLKIDKQGMITIALTGPIANKRIFLDNIKEKIGGTFEGLFNSTSCAENQAPLLSEIEAIFITGSSLDEIEEEIKKSNVAETLKNNYLAQIAQLRNDIKASQEISSLNLSPDQELLFRKLLELKSAEHQTSITFDNNLKQAFLLIDQRKFQEALKIAGLNTSVDKAFLDLSKLTPEHISNPQLQSLVEKSQKIARSSEERKLKLDEFDREMSSDKPLKEKSSKLAEIFINEHNAMKAFLDQKPDISERVVKDIRIMCDDMVRLMDRTAKGEPALTSDEQNAYYAVVQKIATEIGDGNMSGAQFKIPHSATGTFSIDVQLSNGNTKKVNVDIGTTKLPYALTKPAHGECIFSYGGSRGSYDPSSDVGEDYAQQKKRFMTHSRLLGVGQYGTVKEVESLLTGLNSVMKKGFVGTDPSKPTFTDAARQNPKTRALTSRDDPLYRVEVDVLKNLATAEQSSEKKLGAGGTQVWTKKGKVQQAGSLYSKAGRPEQYQLLTERAKGETYADTANKTLSKFSKEDKKYHDPVSRDEDSAIKSLPDLLTLSQSIVQQAQRFSDLGFSHNDIKPENFLYKRNPDGTYNVKFIDWATGGFQRDYTGSKSTDAEVFKDIFGDGLSPSVNNGIYSDKNGRFVKQEGGKWVFGINPTLQILHGARNGTLPYICPTLVDTNNPNQDTHLTSTEQRMDDWALTAMVFGVCKQDAYFELVKGRVVNDYVVPGILGPDGGTPPGLRIEDDKKFNTNFACADNVMYIPSNQREGEPLHLYRRLQHLKDVLKNDTSAEATSLVSKIDGILNTVSKKVAEGVGLTKQELQTQLNAAQECIKAYNVLNDPNYQQAQKQGEALDAILKDPNKLTADALLQSSTDNEKSKMEILCTYPRTPEQKKLAAQILNTALNPQQLVDKFLSNQAPCAHLLKQCIAEKQEDIFVTLMSKVVSTAPDLLKRVKDDGLLHYAAQQGMSDAFKSIVNALSRSGVKKEQIFDLMLNSYGPGNSTPHLLWSTNCFHTAIRNNNKETLATILQCLPENTQPEAAIKDALYFCAVLGNKDRFEQILTEYNNKYPNNPITPKDILAIKPDRKASPYHLFLSNEANLDIIPWEELNNNKDLAKQFLAAPPDSALLIAAKNRNIQGFTRLIELSKTCGLTPNERHNLFTHSDSEGKNVLNYLLEYNDTKTLSTLLNNISDDKELVINLLSNPNPVNPLKNYLNSSASDKEKFAVIEQVLNIISPDLNADNKFQHDRMVILLVNQDWLIKMANDPNNVDSLRQLLCNDKLSIPYKQALFAQLKERSETNSNARTFYDLLLKEVAPSKQQSNNKTATPSIPVEITREVLRQQNDIKELIKQIGQGAPSKELEGQLEQLATEKTQLELSLAESTARLNIEREEHEEITNLLQGQLSIQTDLLKNQQKQIENLTTTKDSIDIKLANSKKELLELEQQANRLAIAQKQSENLVGGLQAHLAELNGLITSKQLEINTLLELQKQTAAKLDASQKEKTASEKIIQELEEKNQQLDEKLKASEEEAKNLTKSLQEKDIAIVTLQKKIALSENKASQLEHQLSESKQENTELENKKSILEKELRSSQENIIKLNLEIDSYKNDIHLKSQEIDQLTRENAQSKSKIESLSSELIQKEKEIDNLNKLKKDSETTLSLANEQIAQLEKHIEDLTIEINIYRKKLDLKSIESQEINEQLMEKIDISERRLAEYEKSISELKIDNENLSKKVSNLEKEQSKLKADKQGLIHQLDDIEKISIQRYSDLTMLRHELDEKNAQLNQLQSELDTSKATIKTLEAQKKSLTAENENFKKELSESKQNIEQLKASIIEFENEKIKLNENINQSELQIQDLNQKLSEKETTIGKLETSKIQLNEQLKSANTEIEKLNQHVEFLTKQIQSLNERLSAQSSGSKDEIDALNKTIQEKEATIQTDKKRINELEENAIKVETEVIKLQSELESSQKEREALRTELTSTQKQLAEKTAALSDLQTQLTTANEQIATLQSENTQLRTSLDESKKKIGTLENSIKENQQEIERSKESIDTLTRKLSEEGQKKAILEASKNETENQLNATKIELELTKEALKGLTDERALLLAEFNKTLVDINKTIDTTNKEKATFEQNIGLLKSQQEALEKKLDELSQERNSLEKQLQNNNKQLEEKNEEIDVLKTELVEANEKITSLEAENLRLTNENQALQVELTESKEKVDQLEKDISQKESDLAQLDNKNKALTQQLEDSGKSADKLQNQIAQLQSQLTQKEKDVTDKTLEITQLEQSLSDAADHIEATRQKITSLERNNAELNEQLKRQSTLSEEDKGRIKLIIEKQGGVIKLKNGQIKELTENYNKQLDEIARLNNELQESHKTQSDLQAQLEKTQVQLKTTEARIEKLEKEQSDLKSQIGVLTKDLKKKEDQLQETTQYLEAERALNKTLTQTNQESTGQLDELKKQLKETNEKIKSVAQEKSGLKKQLKDEQGKSRKASNKIKNLNEQIENLKEKLSNVQKDLASKQAQLEKNTAENTKEKESKQQKINQLKSEIKSLSKTLETDQKALEEAQAEIANLKAALKTNGRLLDSLSAQIRAKDQQIEELQKFNRELQQKFTESNNFTHKAIRSSIIDRATKLKNIVDEARQMPLDKLAKKIKKQKEKLGEVEANWNTFKKLSNTQDLDTDNMIADMKSNIQELELIYRQKMSTAAANVTTPTANTPAPAPAPTPSGLPTVVSGASDPAHIPPVSFPTTPIYLFGELTLSPKTESKPTQSDKTIYSHRPVPVPHEQIEEMLSKKGLPIAPTGGKTYSFHYDGEAASATLHHDPVKNDGTDDNQQKEIAISIVNMIDNVLAKTGEAHVKTTDPFVAEVAQKHLQYLKEKGIETDKCTIQLNGNDYKPTDDASNKHDITAYEELKKGIAPEFETHSPTASDNTAKPEENKPKTWLEEVKCPIENKKETLHRYRETMQKLHHDSPPATPASSSPTHSAPKNP